MWLLLSSLAFSLDLPRLDEPLRTGEKAPGDAAVVIGISDYLFVPDVPFADRDARAFRDWALYSRGIPSERITELGRTASKEVILDAVAQLGKQVSEGGTVWFFFAGHGAPDPVDGKRLLLGADVQPLAVSMGARGVSLEDIHALATAGGGKSAILVDACYAGLGRTGEALLPGKRMVVPTYAVSPSAAALEWNAAGPNQLSGPLPAVEQGAFSYFAIGALRGWADGELDGKRDGAVTAEEAQAYVGRALRTLQVRDQEPVLSVSNPSSWVMAKAKETGPSLVEAPRPGAPPVVEGVVAARPALGLAYPSVLVPTGTFVKGAPKTDKYDNIQKVRFTRAFRVGTYEVTQALWESLMGENPVATKNASFRTHYADYDQPEPQGPCRLAGVGPDLPVVCVSIEEAAAFADKLSARDGLTPVYASGHQYGDPDANGWRLPTDAQWEYLMKAGGKAPFQEAEEAKRTCAVGNLHDASVVDPIQDLLPFRCSEGGACNDGFPALAPVGTFEANAWGLYDMLGNAGEWVLQGSYPWRGTVVDPVGGYAGYREPSYATCLGTNVNFGASAEPADRRTDLGVRLVRWE